MAMERKHIINNYQDISFFDEKQKLLRLYERKIRVFQVKGYIYSEFLIILVIGNTLNDLLY